MYLFRSLTPVEIPCRDNIRYDTICVGIMYSVCVLNQNVLLAKLMFSL